ncbi:fumarylacetoacetate hydrolase family protein [Oceanobacillus halotolerans]|uniref:fumarylacetoacetate hydrolase family protein n=1 Tax=Oceanobacillus halotolerans TaxID=2663380 RepID=UPI0013D16021|nr:fumarylacetoacetate hydrolase family protein [Oceanobacillus halotolerans]
MRLVSYQKQGSPEVRMGFMVDDVVVDLQKAYQHFLKTVGEEKTQNEIETLLPADPSSFYTLGMDAINRARDAHAHSQVQGKEANSFHRKDVILKTPNPNPSKIICVGKNYAEHAAEMQSNVPDYPVLFAKFTNSLIGPEDAIVKPEATEKLDYEVELTIVIGEEASRVSRKDALNYIAGYTIGNDTSARDLQKRTPQWLQGKTLDNSTPIGPWVVTSDEVGDPNDLSVRSFVNGEKRQASHTSKLIFDVRYLIEFISNLMTLKPGDIIMTGTPNGVGFAMDPPQFLQDGDKVTLEIDKIGQMENMIVKR